MKGDILNFLEDFYESGNFSKGANASFIALIPKVQEPQSWESKPISLVGCMYKVVVKISTKRLQGSRSTSVIDGRQSAFFGGGGGGGRNILHDPLIANKVVEDVRRKKKKVDDS